MGPSKFGKIFSSVLGVLGVLLGSVAKHCHLWQMDSHVFFCCKNPSPSPNCYLPDLFVGIFQTFFELRRILSYWN